jgi:hypothetical protein
MNGWSAIILRGERRNARPWCCVERAMTRSLVLSFVIAALCFSLRGQTQPDNPPSESELSAISARGRALAGYDAAAWHSTDAVEPLNPPEGAVQLYIARETNNTWTVMWGRFNESKTKFLISYEAQEGASPEQYSVIQHDPPMEDGDVYLRAAKAHELAAADFLSRDHPNIPFNISVLPAPFDGWYVYVIPAQTDAKVLPSGADVRYTVSADGETISERLQMHATLAESSTDKPQVEIQTNDLSDVPEDSDVFHAMSLNAAQGDWVATKKYVYAIGSDGSIIDLGKIVDVLQTLQSGGFPAVVEPYRSMILTDVQRFVAGAQPQDAVEAFLSFSGARCNGETPWMKFSIVLHNTSAATIILNRRALWNGQLRFAATGADILAGKYEKIAVLVLDKTDYSDPSAFFLLGPDMVYHEEREYAVTGANLTGKSAVQFLFFTWPPTEKDQIDALRARGARVGNLYTDDIETPPAPIRLDPNLSGGCHIQ